LGAIIAVMATGMVAYGLYALVVNQESRSKFLTELKDDPLGLTLALVMTFFGLMFFWSVMIPALGEVPIRFSRRQTWHVWSVSGIAFVVFLALVFLASARKK